MEKFQNILYKYYYKIEKENFLLERLKIALESLDTTICVPSDFEILLGKEVKSGNIMGKVCNIDPYGVLLENNEILKFNQIEYIRPLDTNLLSKILTCNNDISEIQIKALLEANNFNPDLINELEEELSGEDALLYRLKDLYKKLLQSDKDGFYLKALECVLHIINLPDHRSRIDAVINELQSYRWISYISMFIDNLNGINTGIENYIGVEQKVYGINNVTLDGQIVFIEDRWFKIKDNITTTTCQDDKLNNLAKVLKLVKIEDNQICFPIMEELTISINIITREVSINNEPIEFLDTLRILFMNAQIPFAQRSLYPYILLVLEEVDSFIEVDIAVKITNRLNGKSIIVFNYDKVYHYSDDVFYEVQDVDKYIVEMRHSMDYDLSEFLRDKVSAELLKQKEIRDSKKTLKLSIKNTKSEIQKIKDQYKEIDDIMVNESLQYLLATQLKLERKLKDIENDI